MVVLVALAALAFVVLAAFEEAALDDLAEEDLDDVAEAAGESAGSDRRLASPGVGVEVQAQELSKRAQESPVLALG